MKRKRQAATTPAKPRLHFSGRARLILYGLALAVAILARGWLMGPEIPGADLREADRDVVQAIEVAEANVRRSPRSPEMWGELGLLLSAHSYAVEAETCFQKAAELDTENWRWFYFKAVSEQRTRPEQAIQTLRGAIARGAAGDPPRLLLAELLLKLGRLDEAEREFRTVLKASSGNARAQLGLSRVLVLKDQLAEAVETLRAAKSHPSTRKAAHQLLAQAEQRLGKTSAAEAALAQASQLPRDAPWPHDPLTGVLEDRRVGRQSYLDRAAALQRSGALKEANEVAQQMERKYHDVYLLVEGRERLEQGNAAGAEAALREALQLEPDSTEIVHTLGQALAAQEKLEEAVNLYRGLLKREPSYGPAWLELGRCLQRQESKEALSALRSAVAYMPLDPAAHEALADCLLKHRLHAESRKHFALAKQLRGDH
jgi:tetratricopeptide (TPR) repeat protein